MTEYYYDKYSINRWYEEATQSTEGSFAINTDNLLSHDISEEVITRDIEGGDWALYDFKTSYNIQGIQVYGQFIDYELNPAGTEKSAEDVVPGDIYYRIDSIFYTSPNGVRKSYTGLYKYRVYLKYTAGNYILIFLQIMERLFLDVKYIVEKKERGALIAEDIILDHTYPVNGIKDGYWWVRKQQYTIPAPTIISPDNAFEVNKKNGDAMPYLVFQLNPREENDSNLYHARVRLGLRSDFATYEVMLESKEDQSSWEYYDGANWASFPADGVPAGTKVRIKPDVSNFGLGFWYWDATAHNPQWGYGVSSQHRMIIIIDETGDNYALSINGIEYKAIQLRVSESSNGELGSIEIVLSNHNI